MMRRLRLLLAFALLFSAAAFAQTVNITGTITDLNGNPYYPGTASAFRQVPTGQNPGTPVNGPTAPGGVFSLNVIPGTYIVTVCSIPVNIGPTTNPTPVQVCFNSPPINITFGQDVSGILNPVAAQLGPKLGGGGGGGGSGPTVQTNGISNSLQTTLNFVNQNVFQWANPAGGVEQLNFSFQSANCFIAAPNGIGGIPNCRAMVPADFPASPSVCGPNLFGTGIDAGLIIHCTQPSFSNLLGVIVLPQTPLLNPGDLLSVSGGALVRIPAPASQDFFLQGANGALSTWSPLILCGDPTHTCAYSTTTHQWSNVGIVVGTGTINNSTQFSGVYYSGAGSNNVLSGVAPPTTPNVPWLWCSTPSGGSATAPTWCEPGVPINAQTGTSYTVVTGDRESLITFNNASPVAVSLSQAGTVGFDHNFNVAVCNIGAGLVTITPTVSTINGLASIVVANHWCTFIYSDNINYRSVTMPDAAAFGTACTNAIQWNPTTGLLSCGLISLTSGVSGLLPLTNVATQAANTVVMNATSGVASPTAVAAPAGGTNGCSGTTDATTYTAGTGWGCHQITTSSVNWNSLLNPNGNLSLAMAAFTSLFTFNATTGAGVDLFKLTDTTNNTGTGIMLRSTLASGSAMIPFQADINGIGWRVNNAGNLAPVSTATLAIPGTVNGVVVSKGPGAAIAIVDPGSVGQFYKSQGNGNPGVMSDFPDVKVILAANCNGVLSTTVGGAGWSLGTGGTVNCRQGTNNLGGYILITDASTTFAVFQIPIPEDDDVTVAALIPYIRFQIASADATNLHTIIPSIQVACYKGDGSTTDDVAPNAAHSLGTITLNGNANRFWSTSFVQMNSTDMTGCIAGALMQVTVGRATDTATDAKFYSATITFPRRLTVQAN